MRRPPAAEALALRLRPPEPLQEPRPLAVEAAEDKHKREPQPLRPPARVAVAAEAAAAPPRFPGY